jgi:hypothetical protein
MTRTGVSVIQTACDRCTQGVMDCTNPHLLGVCRCECHGPFCDHCGGDCEEPHTDCDWGPIVPCSVCKGSGRAHS